VEGAKVLRDYVKRERIDLVQAFDAPTSVYMIPLGRALGLKATISSHLYCRDLIYGLQYWALRVVDVLSDRIVVNAEAIGEHLRKDFGVPAERIFVSHNGVETDVFFPRADERKVFEPGAVVVGSLCVMREEKRIEVLIEAFAQMRREHGDEVGMARLLLVGDGPMREGWQKLAMERGLSGVFHLEQTSGNVPEWLRQMDVFVMSSRSEGFPNAVLEAMACGLVPVASRVGGIPELVTEGESGLLFESGNVAELAGHLRKLVTNAPYRKQLSEAAAARAHTVFPMERAAERMGAFYEGLIRKTG
jgi:glycosyltransferase involved in cell wall biosynthesis